nr:MAG TPA: hypothetical protein [Bacteriophage sp.]
MYIISVYVQCIQSIYNILSDNIYIMYSIGICIQYV